MVRKGGVEKISEAGRGANLDRKTAGFVDKSYAVLMTTCNLYRMFAELYYRAGANSPILGR